MDLTFINISGNDAEYTDMFKQYFEIKQAHRDCIVFYRLGDFYEMFFEDAETASKVLDLALTGRNCGGGQRAPMCGVPFHSSEGYITKLVSEGYKVAICEQLEDAAAVKGLVKRDVVRIVTSGTINISLDERRNNYLAALYVGGKGTGIVFADVSTGEIDVYSHVEGDVLIEALNDIARYSPGEIIVNILAYENKELISKLSENASVRNFYDYAFNYEESLYKIKQQFKKTPEQIGFADANPAISALGAIITYLEHTQKQELSNLNSVNIKTTDMYSSLDMYTLRNLEIFETYRDKKGKGSLLNAIDETITPMGARLMKNWIASPLINLSVIRGRHDAVEELVRTQAFLTDITECLKLIADIQRIMSKIAYKSVNCRDLLALQNSLDILPTLKTTMRKGKCAELNRLSTQLDTLADIHKLIFDAIDENAPITLRDGGLIKDGYDETVDEKRKIIEKGTMWINAIAQEEREKLGIKNLKVGYNRVFGYYIEVSRGSVSAVPDYFIRKQTLANAERYVIPKIKEIEEMINEARDTIEKLEYDIFTRITQRIAAQISRAAQTSEAVAVLDCLVSFAALAKKNNYVRPLVNEGNTINIKDGRHPVIEHMLPDGRFIENDCLLDTAENQISIITGPNMAGKSTFMRQTALIVLLAQIGCFVPAQSAEIGIVDRIFTRIGASDNLSMGESTFMVEMKEVAFILSNATQKSLIILDEVGRGTSTYDGLAIAWSVIEHIANKCGARTLFATHYHELTGLSHPKIKNYSVAVTKEGNNITFLRKIMPGGADDSYGIEVAHLAGVEESITRRAKEIVMKLEKNHQSG